MFFLCILDELAFIYKCRRIYLGSNKPLWNFDLQRILNVKIQKQRADFLIGKRVDLQGPKWGAYSKKILVFWKIHLVSDTAWFHPARTPNHSLDAHPLHNKWSACLEMTRSSRKVPIQQAFQYNQIDCHKNAIF